MASPSTSIASSAEDKVSERTIDRLYQQHWQAVCERLRRVFGDGPPEPEDLAQEAFARLADRPACLSRIEHPRAYLVRAAVNLGLNSINRVKTARKYVESALLEHNEVLMKEPGAEDVYMMTEKVNVAQKAIQELSEKQRTIILRSRFKGETYAQISAATGWSQADISRQLKRALALLQDAIDQYESGD